MRINLAGYLNDMPYYRGYVDGKLIGALSMLDYIQGIIDKTDPTLLKSALEDRIRMNEGYLMEMQEQAFDIMKEWINDQSRS